jgi:hypothetical protein
VVDVIADRLGIKLGSKGVSATVTFEDEKEGSPAYKVGTKATVRIIEDRVAAAIPTEGPPGGQISEG